MDSLHFVEMPKGIVLCPRSYLTVDPSQYNACGPDGIGELTPDKLLGLDISDLCNVHDHMSSRCANLNDEVIADAVFAANLILRVVNSSNASMVWPRMILATKYIIAVSCTTFTKSYWATNSVACPNGRYLRSNEHTKI